MLKIGIITLSDSDNCGSLLQCYALKKVLAEFGTVDVINFSSEASHRAYDIFPKGLSKNLLKNRLFNLKKLVECKQGYSFFRKQYLQIKDPEIWGEALSELEHSYDVVVTGSDQVWNVKMSDFDKAFFVGWTSAKKIAYAPSLGGTPIEAADNFDEIQNLLNRIEYISVREEFGKKCVERILNRNICKVLDPTLLLEEEMWSNIIDKPLISGDYIFYYSWAYCEDSTSKIVSDEAKKMGIPVYVIDARKWLYRSPEKWGFTLYKKNGPHVFLNLMKYAKRCYVESFHGIIFAYIFKKNFWVLDTHEKIEQIDVRLMEMIELFGAKDRVLTEYNVAYIDQENPFNYCANPKLERMKQISIAFLKEAFSKINDGDN